ncbi:MAG: MtrAB system histidine kinase MtrB [Actinomycetota bacterium]|nr:MtrAB system histidine kinase MtrB [Actinomycetota bacterium]
MHDVWRRGTHLWRRSLRLRVITTTVVLSLLVLAALGTFLVQRIQAGLLDAKVGAALAEASAGTQQAQAAFDGEDDTGDPNVVRDTAVALLERLAGEGGEGGRNDVVLVRTPVDPAFSDGSVALDSFDSGVDVSIVPSSLRMAVQSDAAQHWSYTSFQHAGVATPAVAVGASVSIRDVGRYELYHLFPLDDEAATMALVRRTVGVAALALVALVGLIAAVVTHQVVTPVRMAARIAERLAAGRLEDRMHVRGEDDLARLAASFNKMATNLQRHIRQLEDLSRVQRRFVSDVSHELRTPLTTVRMAADVLFEVRDDFDPAVARSAELLQTQLDRFEALLGDLLEISRFDAGAAQLDIEPVDVRDVVTRVVEATEPLAERRGSTVTVHRPDHPCVAEADSRRVERVLRNLVVNAIEHGEGHPIDIRVACDGAAVAVAVRDHGVGLRPGESALVFNRFWRADPARARTTGGTGLGLAIALEDAHLHGGWLQAWGQPGDGSQFRLTLPRFAGQSLEASPIPLEPEDSSRARRELPVGAPYQRTEASRG